MVLASQVPTDTGNQDAIDWAAFSDTTIKDTNSRVTVEDINADLFRVDLAPTNLQVTAVVLTGTVLARYSEVVSIDYQVTVLHGRSDRVSGFTLPILANSPDWNGTYGAIGSVPVLRGRPSETLP